jgi:hypothetical protein
MLTKVEDERTRLRHRIMRMRTILCFAKDPRAEAGLRELIADAEARLTVLAASGVARHRPRLGR